MTNKVSGLGDNFLIGGYDLSGDVASLDQISGGPALLDVTPINTSAHVRIGGLRDGSMQFTSFFENSGTVSSPSVPATTVAQVSAYSFPVLVTISGGTLTSVKVNGSQVGTTAGTYVVPALGSISITYSSAPTWAWTAVGTEHNALSGLPRTDVVATYLRGTTLGNPAASINGKQISYDPTRDNSGNLTLKVEVQSNGYGLEWGQQITAGLRTDTTATTGAAFDLGAGGTNGAQAYLQLTGLVGTSVDVKVRHCTTSGGTYADLIDFGSQAAIGSFRGTAAGTVNEFLKVVTSGTFTYAQFAVMFVFNSVAVTFYMGGMIQVPFGNALVNRIEPALPAHAYKTYGMAMPLRTHWVKATCEQAGCEAYRTGWVSTFDLGTELGQAQAAYCAADRERSFSMQRVDARMVKYVYPPGNRCFRSDEHKAPLERPARFYVAGGDWRGFTGTPRVHVRAEDWVEDFSEHQDRLASAISKG